MTLERKALERILLYISLLFPFSLLFQIIDLRLYFLSLFLLFLSFLLELRERYLPRLFINFLGISFIFLFFLTVNLSNFLENALETLLLLLSLKFFEKKRLRDYFQIYLMEFLILCGASFYYAGVFFFLLLLLALIFFGYSLFFHLYFEEGEVSVLTQEEFKAILFSFGALIFSSLFLSTLFFVGLPRLQVPLFNVGVEREKAKTGFTDKIRLGAFSEIQESSSPVLRIVFEDNLRPDPNSLYFRVIAFDYFDGKTWQRTLEEEKERSPKKSNSPLKKATFYLLSEQDLYLPVLEGTKWIKSSFPFKVYKDGIFKGVESLNYPVKYEIYFISKKGEEEEERDLERFLQVPKVSEKIKELAKKLKGKTERETVENLLTYFAKEGFRYSLSSLPLGESALERFLFEVKRGNCEYFAGATALLLRLNGIPTRVIGGYKGALYNPQGGYYLVQERFAHSWVEAYFEGGWQRIDPTPGSSFEILTKKKGILEVLRLYYDLLNYYYTRVILDYDYGKQKRLFDWLKGNFSLKEQKNPFKDFEWEIFPKKMIALLIFLGLFLGVALLLRYKKNLLEPKEKKLLKKFLKELERRGYLRTENEGLFEVVEKIKEEDLKRIALRFVNIYGEYYYKDRPFNKKTFEELLRCLRELQSLN